MLRRAVAMKLVRGLPHASLVPGPGRPHRRPGRSDPEDVGGVRVNVF